MARVLAARPDSTCLFLSGRRGPAVLDRQPDSEGTDFWQLFVHAVWRAVLLIVLGIFLAVAHHSQTYWTFEDTLTQIGLGYVFLFLWHSPEYGRR